ncbi:MAG: FtsX-like permease family protein [Planctomycetota bacterium]
MNLVGLLKRSLVFYWRTNVALCLTAIVAAAILSGALCVGDSVRYSLIRQLDARLGSVKLAVPDNGRFFRQALADDLAVKLKTDVAPVLHAAAMITNEDGSRTAGRIGLFGVDGRFFKFAGQDPFGEDNSIGIVLNDSLAEKLNVKQGDEVLVRLAASQVMSPEIPLSPDADNTIAFRLPVLQAASPEQFGRFSLDADQRTPLNAFISLGWLQRQLGRQGRANMLLVGEADEQRAGEALKEAVRIEDLELNIRQSGLQGMFEIRSDRIFIEQPLARSAVNACENPTAILTYFVNELRLAGKATPYSFVAAMSASDAQDSIVPLDMNDDQIIISRWLADDLGAKAGDVIDVNYFAAGEMRRLERHSARFHVKAIVELNDTTADSSLTPDFPGLADMNSCRDFKPGIPIELQKIREKDEQYWNDFKGTPKAFITLSAGQKIWVNRFGSLTAIRYSPDRITAEDLEQRILQGLEPAELGLYFVPVRDQGQKAQTQGTDFGGLFLGMSFFLIIASVVLLSLIFVFNVEKRGTQAGILMACGFRKKQVRRIFIFEAGLIAVFSSIVGAFAGPLYTRTMIYGLRTLWSGAVAGSSIYFHAETRTILMSAVTAGVVSMFAMAITLHRQLSRPPHELLVDLSSQYFGFKQAKIARAGLWIAIGSAGVAVVLIGLMLVLRSRSLAAVFFAAGGLLLVAELAVAWDLLKNLRLGRAGSLRSLPVLALKNTARRCGRSLAVIGLLATGCFLVIAVGANRKGSAQSAGQRDSGTGGFALLAESTVPIVYDLDEREKRKSLGLDPRVFDDVNIVQLRVQDGDDASCLNLNRAQRPRVLGVKPDYFIQAGAFRFSDSIASEAGQNPWALLNADFGKSVVPAVADYTTIVWALGKKVGDEIDYVDQQGRHIRLKLVGMITNSILQGSLIIAEKRFVELFPLQSGYRMFLIDAPKQHVERVSQSLVFALRDLGFDITSAEQRIEELNTVENTYLSIFQLLGGLGLILGSVALAMVVLRNVLDRRGELAMLRAVGFEKKAIRKMIEYEHYGLLLAGLAAGVIAGIIAVTPVMKSAGQTIPYVSLSLTVVIIALSGIFWVRLAAGCALKSDLLDALRNE